MKSSCRYSEGSEGEGLRSLGPNIFFQVRGAGRSDIGGKLVLQCYRRPPTVGGVCNFLGSVSSQQKYEVMDEPVLQLQVTAQFYLESKRKYILEV